jgi:hypothetical protein
VRVSPHSLRVRALLLPDGEPALILWRGDDGFLVSASEAALLLPQLADLVNEVGAYSQRPETAPPGTSPN